MLKAIYKWTARIGLLAWLCLLVVLGAKFTEQNPQVLHIRVLSWGMPEASVGVALFIAILLGVATGICAFLPSWLVSKAKIRSLKSKLKKSDKKLESQRQLTFTDPNIKQL